MNYSKDREDYMRTAIRTIAGMVLAAIFVCAAHAQDDSQIAALQEKLKSQVALTRLTSTGDIAVAGSVVVLQKDGLWMCGMTGAGPYENTYKNGKFSVGRFGWALSAGLLKIDTNSISQLEFVPGDKFWVTAFSVKKDGIHFGFLSDPINDVRYYTQMKLPFSKGSFPSADEAMKMIAEVLTIEPSENAAQNPQSAVPAPAPAMAPANDGTTQITGLYVFH